MVRNDRWIKGQALNGMIRPFEPGLVREGIISYGVSSYGYDIRVGRDFKIFKASPGALIDPKNFGSEFMEEATDMDSCIIPPNSFALAKSVEYFNIPRDVLALCIGKSTYARAGINVNITPLEPEWCGQLTIEIANSTPVPVRIYSEEGIAQLIFLKAEEECETSYCDRGGKYQWQEGITLPRVD